MCFSYGFIVSVSCGDSAAIGAAVAADGKSF